MVNAESFAKRIERIVRDHNVSYITAVWVAQAEIKLEEKKERRANEKA